MHVFEHIGGLFYIRCLPVTFIPFLFARGSPFVPLFRTVIRPLVHSIACVAVGNPQEL